MVPAKLFDSEKKEVTISLRPYQIDTKQKLYLSRELGNMRVIAQLPTGAGKTHIAVSLINDALQKGQRAAFICDRIELINQTSERLDQWGIDHGVIQAQHERTRPWEHIQVASIQTVARRGINKVDVCIIDECHSLHKAHIKLMLDNPNTFFIGLSATPYSKGLGKHFTDIVSPITIRQLIDQKDLVDFRCFGPGSIDLSDVRTVAGEFNQEDLGKKAENPKLVAEIVETWLKLGEGRQTICFATNIAHSKWIVNEFKKNGVAADHVDCYTPPEERKDMINRLKNGELTLISCVDILTKGFDCPPVSCIIQALPTKSLIRHVQEIGRGLRTFEGKTDCIILDHARNHERLGFIDDIEKKKLDEGKKSESSVAKKKASKVKTPTVCPSCSFLKPAGIRCCPACGLIPQAVIKVATLPGELHEITKSKKKSEYSDTDKQSFLAGLNSVARSKNFKMGRNGCYGWSLYKYKEKFGVMPSSRMSWNAVGEITPEVERFVRYSNIKFSQQKRREYIGQIENS